MPAFTWEPAWIRGGEIREMAWVSKSVLSWCSGIHIIFFEVPKKRVMLRWFSNQPIGEGACCLSGHSSLHLFAFSEKVFNPRIFIYSYPSMSKVCELIHVYQSGYLTTAFMGTDFLVAIGSYPDFPMIIWTWRTGEKIAVVNTVIHDAPDQMLRISYQRPAFIAQLGRISGKLVTWEVNVSGKSVILKDYDVLLPKNERILAMDWCPEKGESILAIADVSGHVYLSNQDGTNIYRIVTSQRCGICTEIEIPVVCWFRGGILLKTTFCQIRWYRKDVETKKWHRDWYVKSTTKPYLLTTNASQADSLLYHTHEGFLMQLTCTEGEDTPVIQNCLNYGSVYRLIDLVYPWGHHLVTMEVPDRVSVLETCSGTEVAKVDLDIDGEVVELLSHMDYPLVVLLSSGGELVFLGLSDPQAPRVIVKYRLQDSGLDLMKFSICGRFLVVAESITGVCYCLQISPKRPFQILTQLETGKQIRDFLLYTLPDRLKLLVMFESSKQASVGHNLTIYELPKGQSEFLKLGYRIELPSAYQNLHNMPGNPKAFVATAYLSRQLHVLHINDWKEAIMAHALPTGHQARQARISTNRHWITSANFDGTVVLRGTKVRDVVATLTPSHRKDLGVKKALTNDLGDLNISFCSDGSLVAMKRLVRGEETHKFGLRRVDFESYERNKGKILQDYSSLDQGLVQMLTMEGLGTQDNETWSDWYRMEKFKREEEAHVTWKNSILEQFHSLRNTLVAMLDENENCPEDEKLPIGVFALDKFGREQRMKSAKDEREDARLQLEAQCVSMDKVANWLKVQFWDKQQVLAQSIFDILGDNEVTNYVLSDVHPHAHDFLEWPEFSKDLVRDLMDKDDIGFWKVETPSELEILLKKQVHGNRVKSIKERIDDLLDIEEDEEKEVDAEDIDNERALEGVTTYQFVEASTGYSSQFEMHSYMQLLLDNKQLLHDTNNLRVYFNKLFNDTYAIKEREMRMVNERIDKIRHIDSELNIMFRQNVPEMPIDPEWHWREKPDTIINVLESEVKTKPYISPSQQDIIDKRAAEAERIRQLLLADDFRERALMAMMDGVLEARWEDLIKRDVKKPLCMLTKNPANYDADDILAVEEYHKEVEFLQREREKYRRILESDFTKVHKALKEGVEMFNAKLHDFFQVKLKIESALYQLNLRYVRAWLRNLERVRSFEEEDAIKEKISEQHRYLTALSEQLRVLQTQCQELRAQHEAMCAREKNLTKKFKSEFPTLRKGTLQILERQFKRRPRSYWKSLSIYDLYDLGRIITGQTKPPYVHHDCLEYAKALENLDKKPPKLPESVEPAHWSKLTSLRRHKIDLELQIKAQEINIAECERIMRSFGQKVAECHRQIEASENAISTVRRDRTRFDGDVEVQLVLKMGQVEISPEGNRIQDTRNAIFIPRDEISRVNDAILKAGERKLKLMGRSVSFHQGILSKEWEHKCLKLRLENLNEDLYQIRSATATREMRECLKRGNLSSENYKSMQQLERQLEAMRRSFEKSLREWTSKLEEVESKIRNTARHNCLLDGMVTKLNVARCEMELQRDVISEERQRGYAEKKMKLVVERSDLMEKLQGNYAELLALQIERELLRLRRYPAFNFYKAA